MNEITSESNAVNKTRPAYSLKDLVFYFFKLGYSGFGGPVALIGYMYRDLVENKTWISDEEYKEGLAIAQLAPGPLAAQLSIYLGFVHYRLLGATLCGLAFVIPSFFMVLILGMAYKAFGGLAWMQAIFYGIGAAVVGIIALSSYKLTIKSVSSFNWLAIKDKWLLWLFYVLGLVITVVTQSEDVFFFIAAGFIYMMVKAPPAWMKRNIAANSVVLGVTGIFHFDWGKLGEIAWFFTKAGAFVFGSGLAIVPFLHGGVVTEYHWLNEKQFIDSVAVAMITPGPVVITVGFIGYLVCGFTGACVAALATFLPCYLFTVLPAPYYKKIAKDKSVKAFVNGITAAVVGALVGAVVIIGIRSITDFTTAAIALASIAALIYLKKVKEPYLILLAAVLGCIIKSFA